MAFNGSGTFNLPAGNPVSGVSNSSVHNTTNSEIAAGLTNCITRDGQSPATANIPMGGYKITGLAAAASPGEALRYEQGAKLAGDTFTGLVTLSAGANIASADTIDLTAATGNSPRITGTTPTSAVTMTAGQQMLVVADGAWPLTYHATTNKLNTDGINYTCSAGDRILYHKDLSGVVHGSILKSLTTFRGTVAMHETTMNLWAQPNIIDGTGLAVTITAIANAPQAGAVRILYPITGTVITHGATFVVEGGQSYTTLAGDGLVFEAVTTSTYKVWIKRKALVGSPTSYAVGDRPLTTDFTQSTARLRAVYVTIYKAGVNSAASLIVDGVAVSTGFTSDTAQATLFAIVPKGGVYSATGTTVTFGTWAEQDIE